MGAPGRVGTRLGYRGTGAEARQAFATRKRCPEADEVVVAWPHEFLATAPVDERTVLCILTHDPKFDVPVLKAAVATGPNWSGVAVFRAFGAQPAVIARQQSTQAKQNTRTRFIETDIALLA